MIKAVIFDMDGVIINTEDMWDQATEAVLKLHGKEYRRDILKEICVGKGFRESCTVLMDYYGLKIDLNKFMDQRRNIIQNKYKNELEFIPGFLEFFKNTVMPNYKTCIATASGRMFIDLVDERLQISKLFNNEVYSIADVNHIPKPDPAVFLFAAEQIGISPEECVVIEDSPNGIKGAKAAGMKCIGITTTFEKEHLQEADIIINSFEEIDLNKF